MRLHCGKLLIVPDNYATAKMPNGGTIYVTKCTCRFLYALNGPPSPEVLTAVRAVLQAISLMLVALVSSGNLLGDKSQRADKDAAKVQPAAFTQLTP